MSKYLDVFTYNKFPVQFMLTAMQCIRFDLSFKSEINHVEKKQYRTKPRGMSVIIVHD